MPYYGPGTNDLTFTPLTLEQEQALFVRYYAGDLTARDEIIQKHLRFVAKISIAFAKHALPEEDAISAGNYGMMQALKSKRFTPGRGVMFSTYLRSWVQGEVRRALREKGEHHASHAEPLCFYPDGAAMTGQMGRAVVEHHRVGGKGAGGPEQFQLRVRIEEEVVPSVADLFEEQQINQERREALSAALATLSPVERATVIGIVCEDKTYSDIGRENNVSRQACKKAHIRAFRKLREVLAEKYADLK